MIMAKLKEATRPQHESLENSVDVLNRLFSLEDYKTLMAKFYRFYSGIEPKLTGLDWSGSGYDLDSRLKLPRIKQDLLHLGFSEAEIDELPPWSDLPTLNTLPAAFGSVYVIEGATLGGQVIKRHLKEQLGLNEDNGGSFFSGYGDRTGEMWNQFRAIITEYSETAQNDEEIVTAAKETFSSFKRCFEEPLLQKETVGGS